MEEGPDGFSVLLDGRGVRTPAGAEFAVANRALATEIAAEWQAQRDKIDPATMPMTKRANTALDRVRGREDEVVEDIVSYASSDLLSYRAENPNGLVEMQAAHWDPVLAWVLSEFGAPFEVQTGIAHTDQPEKSMKRIRSAFAAHDFLALTPLHTMTTLMGSALLTLACAHRHLDADQTWAAAHVDEDWQIAQWGEVEEAAARRAVRRAEFDADIRFLALVSG